MDRWGPFGDRETMRDNPDMTVTTIIDPATGRHSSVIHRCDLSDLGEPYLSLVLAARLVMWQISELPARS
jgi:hypothetical protein